MEAYAEQADKWGRSAAAAKSMRKSIRKNVAWAKLIR
jgi:hypothetical protein